jgi:hypothetical protein
METVVRGERGQASCLALAAACVMLAACGSGTVRSHRASAGPTVASIRAVTPVRPGVVDLEVSSPAVGRTAVRIILPRDYGGRPAARWSVLYLLHGCCDSYLSWTRSTDIVPDPIEESIYAENLAFTRPPAAAEHPGHRRPIRQRHPQLALLAARVAQGMAGDRTSPRHQLASDVVPAARRRSALGASRATARWRRGLHS